MYFIFAMPAVPQTQNLGGAEGRRYKNQKQSQQMPG
jgi:hypothetical protein